MPDPIIDRLEKWNHGHKARSVSIHIDDGYGATCWSVKLYHEHGCTTAAEVNFFTCNDDEGGDAAYHVNARKEGVVFVRGGDDDADWPGLAATITAALDAFDSGVYGKIPRPRKKLTLVQKIKHKIKNILYRR